MTIKDCPKCGGTHYGSIVCPYTDEDIRGMQQVLKEEPRYSKPILCVDFDGVIHAYTSKWTGAETISDGAVPGALRWLLDAIEVFDVQIYSSRSKTDAGRNAMVAWLVVQVMNELPNEAQRLMAAITFCHEKPPAFLTIDDRAICFEGRWDDLVPEHLLNFKPWNKRGTPP